jgi:SpoVK/Ycf46/Vps4 family AAA+-type ATPase
MTPSMLTKLQQLHDRRRTIFIIATNFAENIDAAIKRSGRIDYQYLILPPDLLARTNLLRQHVGKYASEIAVDEVALEQSAKSLVLAVPKEIKNAVRDAAQASTNESGRSKAFWEALRERSARPKTIRMSSYGNRLQQKGAAEPLLTEYLLLMYLLVQSGSDEGGVESVLWRPVRDHIHSADDLGKWVKDEDVCQRLRSMIFGTQQ